MNYYRRYVGDYLRDTARLSMLEHGAYNLLLDHYYAEEAPIPLDLAEVHTMVRAMTPADKKAVEKVLDRYFTREVDGYHNARADHEIEVSQKARDHGKSGGRPRTGTQAGTVTGTKTGSETGTITGSGQPPATSHQPPASYPPAAAAASHHGEKSEQLSTASAPPSESAAAALWIFPEKLTHAERSDAARRLNGHPQGQLLLDELAGAMTGKKPVRTPLGLLDKFIKLHAAGEFSASHAYRIQAEREGDQVRREVASQGAGAHA